MQSPWSPDHQVLPPASWLNGGLNMETKSSAAPVLSSSYHSKTDIDNLSSLKHRESILPLLKLTLLNSLYGGYDKAEGPSRFGTKSRNFTSTERSVFELDSLFSLCTQVLLFSLFLHRYACLVTSKVFKILYITSEQNHERKHKLISTS